MTTKTIFRTYAQGDRAPVTGEYELVEKNGTHTGIIRRFVRGEPLIRVAESSQRYILLDNR